MTQWFGRAKYRKNIVPPGKAVTSVKIVKSHKILDWCDWAAGAVWAGLKPQTRPELSRTFRLARLFRPGIVGVIPWVAAEVSHLPSCPIVDSGSAIRELL